MAMPELPDDLEQALDETGARNAWDARTEDERLAAVDWIESARRTSARSKRVDDVARRVSKGLPLTDAG
jgi:uncharacterized protein YdeI (YjbR/CyaY-like superfamily)